MSENEKAAKCACGHIEAGHVAAAYCLAGHGCECPGFTPAPPAKVTDSASVDNRLTDAPNAKPAEPCFADAPCYECRAEANAAKRAAAAKSVEARCGWCHGTGIIEEDHGPHGIERLTCPCTVPEPKPAEAAMSECACAFRKDGTRIHECQECAAARLGGEPMSEGMLSTEVLRFASLDPAFINERKADAFGKVLAEARRARQSEQALREALEELKEAIHVGAARATTDPALALVLFQRLAAAALRGVKR